MLVRLTPEERASLEANLKDARAQYHTLVTGGAARVIVDQNGERVEFTAANRGALYTYITSLESKLSVLPASLRVLAPAQFFF